MVLRGIPGNQFVYCWGLPAALNHFLSSHRFDLSWFLFPDIKGVHVCCSRGTVTQVPGFCVQLIWGSNTPFCHEPRLLFLFSHLIPNLASDSLWYLINFRLPLITKQFHPIKPGRPEWPRNFTAYTMAWQYCVIKKLLWSQWKQLPPNTWAFCRWFTNPYTSLPIALYDILLKYIRCDRFPEFLEAGILDLMCWHLEKPIAFLSICIPPE
jgi:hypothetical protein